MKMFLILLFITGNLMAAPQLAKISFVRGSVKVDGKKVSKGFELKKGMEIKTVSKSIAKIIFKDKTQVTMAPNSSLEITELQKEKPPMISLFIGTIRSKIRKKLKSKNKNKLIISTKTAAMGVRGTELNVSFNPKSGATSVITFKGNLKMVQKDPSNDVDYSNINDMTESGDSVSITEGRFSIINPKDGEKATIPVKLNPSQFHSLKRNKNFAKMSSKNRKSRNYRPIVLPGIDASKISLKRSGLKDMLVSSGNSGMNIDTVTQVQSATDRQLANANDSGRIPPAGGFLAQGAVVYVAPPPGSPYDPNTETFVPPPNYGNTDSTTGEYQPPDGFEITASGEFVTTRDSSDSSKKPPPVIGSRKSWGSSNYALGVTSYALEPDKIVVDPSGEPYDPFVDILNEYNNSITGELINENTMINLNFEFE